MALSKPLSFLTHLKTLTTHHHNHHPSPTTTTATATALSFRFLSFATPEEAAAERRRRKRRLRIEPPLAALNRNTQKQQQTPKPNQNPNAPKLPEPISELSGKRLDLHNKILTLIRENDLDEAALYTRHSIYSNCRPTIYTVNAVLYAQLRQSKYSDLLSLHRFITQAGVAPNIITYNLIFQTYLDCRRPDTALEYYKQFVNDAPFNPSPTTYRILIKGLVDNGKVDKALELKEEIAEVNGFTPDPLIYHYLMVGCVRNSDADGVFRLFEELKEKKGGVVDDGVVIGAVMKGYFLKGMEKEAMECLEEAVGEGSKVRMTTVAYNSVLDALCKNGKLEEALKLFDRILVGHKPPRRLAVNLGTFNVMVDGYCAEGRFKDAIEVFRKMGDYTCRPDALSFNNLIDQLCKNGMAAEAEELYGEMEGEGVKPDEYTYGVLMDTCFKENRIDDGASYYRKMVETKLRPNLAVYNRVIDELVKAGNINEAKSIYDMMVKKLKMDDASYKFMIGALSNFGRLDEMLKMVDALLDMEGFEFTGELQEFIKGELRKEGREDDLANLVEEKERLKAEAKAKSAMEADASKRIKFDISSLFPSKLGKGGDTESGGKEESVEEATMAGSASANGNTNKETIKFENSDGASATTDGTTEQQVTA